MTGGLDELTLRPADPAELAACGIIWRDAINDYLRPLGQADLPDEFGPIGRLHAHTQATDPERFVVALRPLRGADGHRGTTTSYGPRGAISAEIVAFGSAVVRGAQDLDSGRPARPLWYLSMLFVRPDAQGAGLGRAILERLLPPPDFAGSLATTVDSLQPISTALYSRYGIGPRQPILHLVGQVRDADALGPLPSGVTAIAFESIAVGPPGGAGQRELVEIVDRLDREVLGVSHTEDHRLLRGEGRLGFVYRGPDDRPLGYGYGSPVGRIGPIAVRDAALLSPIVGHLAAAVPARGASAIWIPGDAGPLLATLLRAGLRTEEFPLLLCWDRPFADFSRYLPISPGLL